MNLQETIEFLDSKINLLGENSNKAKHSYLYARDVLKARFELGEKLISKDSYYSFAYARDVLKARFELGEKTIFENPENARRYLQFLKSLYLIKKN